MRLQKDKLYKMISLAQDVETETLIHFASLLNLIKEVIVIMAFDTAKQHL